MQLLCFSFACALNSWSTLFSIYRLLRARSQKNQKCQLKDNKRKSSSISSQVKGVEQDNPYSPFKFHAGLGDTGVELIVLFVGEKNPPECT